MKNIKTFILFALSMDSGIYCAANINSIDNDLFRAINRNLGVVGQNTEEAEVKKERELIGLRGNVNVVDVYGNTGLMQAVITGSDEMVALLINAGANIHAVCDRE